MQSVDIDQIKPGMSMEVRAAAVAQVAEVLKAMDNSTKTDGAATGAAIALKAAAGGAFAWIAGVHPVYLFFVGLMVIDFITGVWAAGKAGLVDSAKSREGIQRKVVQVLLVLASEFLYRTLQSTLKTDMGITFPSIPAGAVVAGFYCAHEFISIVENAGKLGVYIPRPIRAALKKLNELEEGENAQGIDSKRTPG